MVSTETRLILFFAAKDGEARWWKRKVKKLTSNSTFKKRRSWHTVPSLHSKETGKQNTVTDFIFLGSKITADGECSHEIKRCLLLGRKAMTSLDSVLKNQRHYFAIKGPSSQSYGFSSSHVWMWELDHKESWALKNWCFWTVALEKILESPLDCKEIKPVNLKGNESWIFIGRTDAEAEAPILWPPDRKSWLIALILGKIEDGRRSRWPRTSWLDGITDSVDMSLSKLLESLACCSPWGRRVRCDWMTEQQHILFLPFFLFLRQGKNLI